MGGGLAPWTTPLVFPAPNVLWDADFVNDQYFGGTKNGTMCQQQLVNLNPSFMENADGSFSTFTAQTAIRRTNKGLVGDGAQRACQILQNRTLTNASWVISNSTDLTVAKTLTGITNVVNSACQVTVNAANATLLQSVTISASTFYGWVYIKRISGTGTIEMTIDGGTTWVALDHTAPAIFNNWVEASKAAQAPGAGTFNMGFRFSTIADLWGIDFVEVNPQAIRCSPVATTTAKLTGERDRPSSFDTDNSVPLIYIRDRPLRVIYAEFAFRVAGGIITASTGTILNVRATDCQAFSAAVTTGNAPVLATSPRLIQTNKVMCWQSPTETGIILNGGAPVTAAGASPNPGSDHFDWCTNGSGSASIFGRLLRQFGLSALPPVAVMQNWTT